MAHRVTLIDQKTNVTAADDSSIAAALITGEGVVDRGANSYKVEAQASPNMTVQVNKGMAFVLNDSYVSFATSQKFWQTILDAVTNVTITAANPTNPRHDLICIKIDTGVTPDSNGNNVATLVAVAGTAAASPVDPAIPSNHLVLARVVVGASVTTITNANISDRRIGVGIKAEKRVVDLTDAATIATDVSLGDEFRVTLGGNRTLANPTNAADGDRKLWRLKQDGTGNRTITLDTKFRLGTDISSVVLSTTAGKIDYLGAEYNATDDKWDVLAFVKGY